MSTGYRAATKKEKEEEKVCRMCELKYENVIKCPTKGQIFILNLRDVYGNSGVSRECSELRGCFRVVDDTHPRFIICEEFRSEAYTGRRALLRSDFYSGIAKVKIVDRVYYKIGKDSLTWEQLAVENF